MRRGNFFSLFIKRGNVDGPKHIVGFSIGYKDVSLNVFWRS